MAATVASAAAAAGVEVGDQQEVDQGSSSPSTIRGASSGAHCVGETEGNEDIECHPRYCTIKKCAQVMESGNGNNSIGYGRMGVWACEVFGSSFICVPTSGSVRHMFQGCTHRPFEVCYGIQVYHDGQRSRRVNKFGNVTASYNAC